MRSHMMQRRRLFAILVVRIIRQVHTTRFDFSFSHLSTVGEQCRELSATAKVEERALHDEHDCDSSHGYTRDGSGAQSACSAAGEILQVLTYPAAPVGVAVVIAVTVLIPPPVVLVAPPVSLAVGLLTGVELGLESSRHDEESDPPTVINADDPPVP
jgi:hypothetical protein